MAWEMPSFEALSQFHERLRASGAISRAYSDRQSNVMFLEPDGNELEALWEPSPKNNPASKPPELFLGSITNSKSGLWCESGSGSPAGPPAPFAAPFASSLCALFRADPPRTS